MAEFVTLSCPSCGAKLKIENNLKLFACSHCGNEHMVKRTEGVISLAPVVEQLKGVKTGVDKTASELAIQRLRNEIQDLEQQKNGIKGPGCMRLMFSIGLVGSIVIGIVIAALFSLSGGDVVGVILIAGFIIAGIVDFASMKENRNLREGFDKKISEKYSALKKHEKIVDRY
jgi:hypothetical protein